MKDISRLLSVFALIAIAALVVERPAAATITLESPSSIVVQQKYDHPCIFGGNSCNNPTGFGYTKLSNNPSGDTYNAYAYPTSPYTVGQIRNILALTDPINFNSFMVGIDVNTTSADSEALQLFSMTVTNAAGTILGQQQFSSNTINPGGIVGAPLITQNNGSGFSDAILKTFDLSTFASADTVQFHLIENGAVDGAEEYFLVNAANPEPVPAPGTLGIMGVGLIGLWMVVRRRKRDESLPDEAI